MATQLNDDDAAISYTLHDAACTCPACIEHKLGHSLLFATSKAGGIEITSSTPTTPSTGSSRSKRGLEWSDDESSSDSEPGQKRARSSLSPVSLPRPSPAATNYHLRLPQHSEFPEFYRRADVVFVDKTRCILDLPPKFRILLLRPPRFGKTTFLSTLREYYDVQTAEQFTQRFKDLAVLTEAPETDPPHRRHLCLYLRLSSIDVRNSTAEIVEEMTSILSFALNSFVCKYASELQISDPREFSVDSTGDMFQQVFELVRTCGQTLFVAVDDYDSPIVNLSPPSPWSRPNKTVASPHEIKELFESCFWGPLLQGSDVIDKLLVAGVYFVTSPALQALGLETASSLQQSCGFTEEEALGLASQTLEYEPDTDDVRRSCGRYTFPSQGGVTDPLLHPQSLINRIAKLSTGQPQVDGLSFRYLSTLLAQLPAESSLPDEVSIEGLIHLLATGAVDCDIDTPVDLDAKAVTWKSLYYAGALTPDPHSPGTLRVAGGAALSVIHSRVDTIFADRHDLYLHFLAPWAEFCFEYEPNPDRLVELLSTVLRDQAQRSFGKKREPNLHGIFELVARNGHCMAPSRAMDSFIVLPPAYAPIVRLRVYNEDEFIAVQLSTLTLLGMWRGSNLNDEPTTQNLKDLHEELTELDEEDLLKRPYAPALDSTETVLVGSFLEPDPRITQLVAVGGARILIRECY
ncbi:hypothetical protein C8R46DRAFT_342221 [Mycena filopes]|nr:hypothetical protein C8R46DRAFT_342221 [Mycena filopes]